MLRDVAKVPKIRLEETSTEEREQIEAEVGRSCGSCSMCCKLLKVDAVESPRGSWCQHCKTGQGGCTIYEERPEVCSGFRCIWLTGVHAPHDVDFRPDRTKVVLAATEDGGAIEAHVDTDRPGAWKTGAYGRYLRRLSATIPIVVHIGDTGRDILATGKSWSDWRQRRQEIEK